MGSLGEVLAVYTRGPELDVRNPHKKVGRAVYTRNPSAGEVDTEDL